MVPDNRAGLSSQSMLDKDPEGNANHYKEIIISILLRKQGLTVAHALNDFHSSSRLLVWVVSLAIVILLLHSVVVDVLDGSSLPGSALSLPSVAVTKPISNIVVSTPNSGTFKIEVKENSESDTAPQDYGNYTPPQLLQRGHPFVDWDTAVSRGQQLLKHLEKQTYTPTRFSNVHSLSEFGYNIDVWEGSNNSIDSELFALGLPAESTFIRWGASTTAASNADGPNQIVGDGFYEAAYSPKNGAIIVYKTFSPKIQQPTKLTKVSDIIYLGWLQVCDSIPGSDPSNVKYIIGKDVSNDSTRLLITRARGNPMPWDPPPTTKFGMDTEGGKALLGSPNGLAAAYTILQHGVRFAGKTISAVDSFKDVGGLETLIFHVVNI